MGVILPIFFFSLLEKIGLYGTLHNAAHKRLLPCLIPSTAVTAVAWIIHTQWMQFNAAQTVLFLSVMDALALMGLLLVALLIVRIYEKLV